MSVIMSIVYYIELAFTCASAHQLFAQDSVQKQQYLVGCLMSFNYSWQGKVGSAFTSVGGHGRGFGGHEAILQSFHATFLQHGMVRIFSCCDAELISAELTAHMCPHHVHNHACQTLHIGDYVSVCIIIMPVSVLLYWLHD